jgi:hypothetical protein
VPKVIEMAEFLHAAEFCSEVGLLRGKAAKLVDGGV